MSHKVHKQTVDVRSGTPTQDSLLGRTEVEVLGLPWHHLTWTWSPCPLPHSQVWFLCFAAVGLELGVLELLTVLTAQLMAGGMLEPVGLE